MKFQSSYAPDVTIEAYLERIRRYSRCSDACFVMTLVYVDRLIETKNLMLTSLNVHRLLITRLEYNIFLFICVPCIVVRYCTIFYFLLLLLLLLDRIY